MSKFQTEEKVFSYIEEHHMINPQDIVVAGVSGGADSVCLLFALLEFAKKVPVTIAVVHINHGIRAEAVKDAAYVESLCREFGLDFYLKEEDVPNRAKAEGLSEEEAGRKVRYEAFYEVASLYAKKTNRPVKIAVAHHANDRAETMLFHLFRGSGSNGLGSIRPVRDTIIRPLLCLERREIEEYLQETGRAYCQDSTNEKDDYTRNRIRHHVLPYVEQHISQRAVRHICQSAEILAETEDYLRQQTLLALQECQKTAREGAIAIQVSAFLELPPILQKRVLLEAIQRLSPARKDITFSHVELLADLFRGESGRTLNLPFGILAEREYDNVVLETVMSGERNTEISVEIDLSKLQDGPMEVTAGGKIFLLELLERERILKKNEEIPQNQYTKLLDCDKMSIAADDACIESAIMRIPHGADRRHDKMSIAAENMGIADARITLRTRLSGDYLMIRGKEGEMHHKALKDYFITEKIPRRERETVLLFTAGSHVLWAVGYRMSEAVKIKEDTKRILRIQFIDEMLEQQKTEDKNG